MTIKIDEGIAIPNNGTRGRPKYPWKTMKVGDSFLTENTMARKGFYTSAKMYGIEITMQREGETGVRVWRTK